MLYQGSNPGIIPERSVKSPLQSCSFHHSEFKIPSSNVHFVQGIPTNFPSTSCLRQLKYDRESVASANTDNIDNSESKFGSWPFLSANNLLARLKKIISISNWNFILNYYNRIHKYTNIFYFLFSSHFFNCICYVQQIIKE